MRDSSNVHGFKKTEQNDLKLNLILLSTLLYFIFHIVSLISEIIVTLGQPRKCRFKGENNTGKSDSSAVPRSGNSLTTLHR
jgi:hypothetical protein